MSFGKQLPTFRGTLLTHTGVQAAPRLDPDDADKLPENSVTIYQFAVRASVLNNSVKVPPGVRRPELLS